MKPIPRILPLIGVAAGGVLAINALAGARQLPDLLSGAKAFAESASKPDKQGKADAAATGEATDAAAKAMPSLTAPAAAKPAAPVCAPTAAELAKEAGLSPAELQVLQSLGERRGQLDQRENDLNTQLALMAAAEAKLDAKVKTLNGLKAEIQGLLSQADQKQAAETDRLVKVFEAMKPKDAAPRMVLLDDSVRLPIAAKMKERSLSAILALMPPAEAKKLTESLAARFGNAKSIAANAANAANQAASQVATPPAPLTPDPVEASATDKPADKPDAKAAPAHRKAPAKQARKAQPRKTAPPEAQAAAAAPTAPAPAKPAPQAPAAASPAAPKAG